MKPSRSYVQIFNTLHIDFVTIWEDMAYKNGPLISPTSFREFMLPYYKQVTFFLKRKGVKKILVDSDGDIRKLVPLFLEGGVDGMYPLEIQAGSDPVLLKKISPRIALIRGMNKRVLATGKEAIDKELEKINILMKKGRYIPMIDHRVPPDVSSENYRYYCERKREIIVNCQSWRK